MFLCLDPEGSAEPAERRRRQQEVENLLERYIERSDEARTDRPVALLLTKFDRVIAGTGIEGDADPGAESGPDRESGIPETLVERVVDARYGMTRHALAAHAPDGAIFAVSSFGPGAEGNRPPTELHPMGLEGPLSWLAEQLEARDRAAMTAVWELARHDVSRLERVVSAYERRYPRSNRSYEFRAGSRRWWAVAVAGGCCDWPAACCWRAVPWPGTTPWDSAALAFEREGDRAAPAIARRWGDLLEWHPSLGLFWPSLERQARIKKAEWLVKAAEVQVANGTAAPDLPSRLGGLKDQAPQLAHRHPRGGAGSGTRPT